MSTAHPEHETAQRVVACTSCGDALEPCEIDHPRSPDEPGLCDACYREFYEFTCCWCEGSEDLAYQHILLVVFDAAAAGISLPGVYRIDRMPYYSQPAIGAGRLWEDCLTWLGFLPACQGGDYPCGHLCRRCGRRALAASLHETRCGAVAVLSV